MKFGTVSAVALAALVMASLLPGPALAQGDPSTPDEYWNIGQEGEPEPRSSQGRDPWATSGESGPTPEPPPESVLPTIPPVATLSPPPLHLWFESGEDDSAAYLEDAEAMLGASHDLCRATPMDLVFVLDGSRSVLAHNFVKVKHFVNALVDSFSVGPSATRVAVVQYSSRVRTEFTLGEYDSKEAVKAAVMRMSYMEEGTVTGKALSHMTEKSFSPEEGARPKGLGVRRVAIVMTDGRSADDVKDSARAAHEDGILVFALGVTDSVDVSELDAIASKPSSVYMHHVDDFELLSKLRVQIVRKICEGLSCLGATGRDGVPGTDLVKEFGLATAPGVTSVEGSSSDHPAFHLDASASLIKDTVSLHPFGLPNEFALVATLRLPIAINSEAPWSLWSARSPDGVEQASLIVDGPSRSVEFSSRRSGRHTFGQLDALFDGEWHKLALSSRHGRVALLVDCRAAGASDVSEARDEAVVEGGTTVVARRADGSTVPIDVQQLQVYCDPERASLEVCCELPNVIDTRCAPRVLVVPTPPPLPSPQPAPAAEPCTCRIGRLGQPGFPGTKGPKGNKGESGFPGKQGRAGYRGFKGARGRTGDGGLTGEQGGFGATGEVGPQGPKGYPGPIGPMGLTGKKGDKGSKGFVGLQGELGPDGDQGNLGLFGQSGTGGTGGTLGDPGFEGEEGSAGPMGPPGMKGVEGLAGSQGDAGYTGFPGPMGPQGEKGVKGDVGIAGVPGRDGMQGMDGAVGLQGLRGPFGVTGAKGDVGDKGIEGPQGHIGRAGPKGDKGTAGRHGKPGKPGPKGMRGSIGDAGEEGPMGDIGRDGKGGPLGPKGDKGTSGDKGQKGLRGLTGQKGVLGQRGSPGYPGSRGITGPRGNPGGKGLAGPPGPAGPLGSSLNDSVVAELCRRVVMETVDKYAGALRRTCIAACPNNGRGLLGLPGPPGPPGLPGKPGEQGLVGFDGDVGLRGLTGDGGQPGDPGERGKSGIKGIKGAAGIGLPGLDGLQGPVGAPGIPGIAKDGVPGMEGPRGYRGRPGPPGQPGMPGELGKCEARDCGAPPFGLHAAIGLLKSHKRQS